MKIYPSACKTWSSYTKCLTAGHGGKFLCCKLQGKYSYFKWPLRVRHAPGAISGMCAAIGVLPGLEGISKSPAVSCNHWVLSAITVLKVCCNIMGFLGFSRAIHSKGQRAIELSVKFSDKVLRDPYFCFSDHLSFPGKKAAWSETECL